MDGAFPNTATNKAVNLVSGPVTVAEGRAHLEAAQDRFDAACRQLASHDERMRTTVFGLVPVADYVRFMEHNSRPHGKQVADAV